MTIGWNEILSGLLALIYAIAAFAGGGAEVGLKVLMFLILPLACIWFGDEMGDYMGTWPISGGGITNTTPGWLVRIGGWLLLLLPVIIGIIYAIMGTKA
jgi:uncharacterized membrane protein YoaT (DUF817 family)